MENERICSHCLKPLNGRGYVIEGGMEYYCSDECLNQHYTEDEYLELYDDGNGDTYWTEWENDGDDDDAYQYVNNNTCEHGE